MFGRFKRKLSRTKSVAVEPDTVADSTLKKTFSLTPSDEQLISRLKFTDDTNLHDKPPRKLRLSVHSQGSGLTGSSERTVFNDVDKGMLSLPTEVLLGLQKYLRPCSEVALRNTCARFLHMFKTPSFYLSGDDAFEWLCMNERDQDPDFIDRMVCGVCRGLHPKSAFPSAERRLPPVERDCRQIWLCAHKGLGYVKSCKLIKAGHEAPIRAEVLEPCSRCRDVIRNRSVADRPDKGTSQAELESENAASLLVTKIALLQKPSPLYNERTSSGSSSYKEVFGVKEVAESMACIDFPICAHLQLGDPYLLSRFCRACINTTKLPPTVKGPPCISETKREFGDPEYLGKCKQSCYQRGCKTKFMFQARESLTPDGSGRRQIWLILAIYRWLGPLQTAGSDPLWKSHAVSHAIRQRMRQKWEVLEKSSRSNRPMPNWSICAYNPADAECPVRSEQVAPYRPSNSAGVEDALKGVMKNLHRT